MLVSVAVPVVTGRRREKAELPLTVQLVSVAVPTCIARHAAAADTVAVAGELPLTVQLVSVACRAGVGQAAAAAARSWWRCR